MPTDAYLIEGGQPVVGEIQCLGAKNFATKAMVAALLAEAPTTLTNVPPIGDVDITREMLQSIGIHVEPADNGVLQIDPSELSQPEVLMPHTGANRIPILLLGVLLHRFPRVMVPVVGGCQIGARKVDFH